MQNPHQLRCNGLFSLSALPVHSHWALQVLQAAQWARCAQSLTVPFSLCLQHCSAHSGLLRGNSPLCSCSFCWEFLLGANFYQRLWLFFLSGHPRLQTWWTHPSMSMRWLPEGCSHCNYSDSLGTFRAGLEAALGHSAVFEEAQSEGQRGFVLAGHRRTHGLWALPDAAQSSSTWLLLWTSPRRRLFVPRWGFGNLPGHIWLQQPWLCSQKTTSVKSCLQPGAAEGWPMGLCLHQFIQLLFSSADPLQLSAASRCFSIFPVCELQEILK